MTLGMTPSVDVRAADGFVARPDFAGRRGDASWT
jgi:hypothetical protein